MNKVQSAYLYICVCVCTKKLVSSGAIFDCVCSWATYASEDKGNKPKRKAQEIIMWSATKHTIAQFWVEEWPYNIRKWMFQIWPKKDQQPFSKDEKEETTTYRKEITRLQHIIVKWYEGYYVLTIHALVVRLGQKW